MNKLFELRLFIVDLTIHDNTNTTALEGMTPEMKTFYSKYLLEYAKPLLIHDQFGQKHPIPKNGGKIIEFRKKAPFAKALTPLSEGVTPSGQTLSWSTLTATVDQYGGYVELSDRLITEAIDSNVIYATENCSDQAGRTLDTITREVLNAGTNVQFADAQVAARHLLVGGDTTATNNHYMSANAIKRAVRALKVAMAKPINGSFVAIVHPDVAYDLMADSLWIDVKKYSDPNGLYTGEIGKLFDVRFVECTEAKIFHANDLVPSGANAARTLTVASVSNKIFTIDEALAAGDATALTGRKVIIKGVKYTVASAAAGSAGAATITVTETVTGTPGDGEVVYPGEAGAAGRDVYSTLILGADAYGITEIEGEGLQQFIKQLGSSGTADPLNQRSTVGWKASKVAERLVEAFMIRVETASTFTSGAN